MRSRKYHGAGNDFVLIDDPEGRLGPAASLAPELVRAICDRHTGVGGDGLIRVMAGDGGVARYMDYYNADGAAAEMCGNGIRCVVQHELDLGRLEPGEHVIGTRAGPVPVRTDGDGRVTADMGTPVLRRESVPMTGSGPSLRVEIEHDGATLPGTAVSMGNPHLVLFCDEIGRALDDATVHGLGSQLEHHPDFPNATNVEFVVVESPTHLRMRVWERGVGETLACGSGACAVAAAAASLERAGPHVRIDMPGGELEVEWEPGGRIWLTGPAEFVFEAEIGAAWLAARGLARHAELVA